MSAAELFARATQQHQQGNLPEAERLYRELLNAEPKHADAWHLLGVVAHQAGQPEPAIKCIEQAVKLAPKNAAYCHDLALIHHQLGQLDGAALWLERLLKIEPRQIEMHQRLVQVRTAQGDRAAAGQALKGLGNALAAQGKPAEARQAYRQALELRPQDVELLNNLGVASVEAGDAAGAIGYYRQALALRPKIAALHNNLGNAFSSVGDVDAAATEYRAALALQPNYPKCANNLGVMLINAGRFEEAITILREQLALRPDLPELHSNLGVALKNLGRIDEALAAYRQALTVDPQFVDAHHNFGNLLLDAGQLDKAAQAYRTALAIKPSDADFHRHLALAHKRQGDAALAKTALQGALALEPEDALTALRAATLCPMIFPDQAAIDRQRKELLAAASSFRGKLSSINRLDLLGSHAECPFHAQFFDGDLRPVREAYAEVFASLFRDARPAARSGQPRVGFVISKGHEGVFLKSLRGVLARLDRELCQLVLLAPPIAMPRIQEELDCTTIELVRLPERGDRLVSAVRDARLDVLYHWEVGTDAINYFLPMFRLAPVQCTSWGIQQTSGMAQMDYYLSSALVEQDGAAAHYREELLLADTLLTYQYRPQLPAEMKTRADFGFGDRDHVFACAQHLGKFHPDFDPLLKEILARDGQAVLAVTQDRYNVGAELLRARWQRTLGDVASRIRWLPRLPEQEYRALLAASDVLLDPPHFGGVNSTYDALAMAQPIVTCPSSYQRGRYTFGCYRKLNVLDCVARDGQEYVEIALRLATDSGYRAGIRDKLRRASEVLWEDASAVTAHERMIETMISAARR